MKLKQKKYNVSTNLAYEDGVPNMRGLARVTPLCDNSHVFESLENGAHFP